MIVASFDLSTELGVPGRFDAPILLDAVKHVEQAVLEAGVDSAQPLLRGNRRKAISAAVTLPRVLLQHQHVEPVNEDAAAEWAKS
jgi:4-hydroxy-2-oxoheptanedioate aldolase